MSGVRLEVRLGLDLVPYAKRDNDALRHGFTFRR
jgi:hypothetical protein